MLTELTSKEKHEVSRALRWILVATQSTESTRATLQKAIDLLEKEEAVRPEDI